MQDMTLFCTSNYRLLKKFCLFNKVVFEDPVEQKLTFDLRALNSLVTVEQACGGGGDAIGGFDVIEQFVLNRRTVFC